MWESLKAYIKDMGYWSLIIILPIILDVIGIIQFTTGNQLTGVPSWILFQIAFLILFIAPFWAYHKINIRLQEHESKIRLIARPSNVTFNFPNPQTENPLADDETSIDITVKLEIWTDIDVSTASLVLNIVGFRTIRRWREFWKFFIPKQKRLIGIPIERQDTSIYRKQIKHNDKQPFEDFVRFRWRGKSKNIKWGDYSSLELALETGSPKGIWRTIVEDFSSYERGVITPI
jgi:hypothetical protein